MRFGRSVWLVGLVLAGGAAPLVAQMGTISGRITEAASNRPLAVAAVVAVDAGGAVSGRGSTGTDGRYRITGLAAGTYTIEVSAVGYEPGRSAAVTLTGAAGSGTADVALVARPVMLEAVTVAAERGERPIKVVDAPAAISVVPTVEITDRPALTIVDHLKGLPGIDISTGGLVQANVVGRGFNNIFSGALLTLVDNRFASVPSLRVNVPAFFSASDQDIQQAEFVLGPGAALYGPNTANGVLAITTKSPFNQQGGTLSLETGLRSASQNAAGDSFDDGAALARVGFRYATTLSPRVAFKVSGEYLTGTEWRMRDPLEPNPLPDQPNAPCEQATGCRDFDLEKYNVDARIDMIPADNTQLIASFGQSNSGSLIEYTGIGAGQAKDWKYTYGQLRFSWNRLFVQAFGNFSNAGDTFLLRTGNPIIDKSRVYAAQAQHATDLGSTSTLTYGMDFAYTDARTEGSINGRNEDDDSITEVGGYLHSVTRLSPQFDFVAALRLDKHSALDDARFSPRGALVYKPNETSSFRVTYNRAYSTPSNNNLFLDIVAGVLPAPYSMTVRAIGTPEGGFNYRGYCGAGGVESLCMRRGTGDAAPAEATSQWGYASAVALQLLLPQLPANLQPAVQGVLQAIPAPGAAQVGTQLRRWERTNTNAAGIQWVDVSPSVVADIARTEPTSSNVLELGYKGVLGDKLRLDANVWWERRRNFVGPLIVESPNVFLDPASTLAYLQATFQPALTNTLIQAGLSQPVAQATAAQVTTNLAGVMAGQSGGNPLAGQAGIPVGTVVPDSPLTGTGDIFFTYRNFGKVHLWGTDVSFDYLFNDRWSVGGAYSFVNKDFFTASEAEGPTDVALNAPKNKGALALRYAEGIEGFAAEARGRFVQGFPINSGDYQTTLLADGTREPIEDYTVFDGTVSYRFANGLLASLSVQNVLNERYQTFVGLPYLGRLLLTRLTYSF